MKRFGYLINIPKIISIFLGGSYCVVEIDIPMLNLAFQFKCRNRSINLLPLRIR